MKKIIIIILLTYMPKLIAQPTCGGAQNIVLPSSIPNARTEEVPDQNTPVRVIKVNFHIIQKANGTGNFTETSDGNGNINYSGVKFIEDQLNLIRKLLEFKPNHNMPPNNTAPNIAHKYDFIVEGLYFRKSDIYYNDYGQLSNAMSTYEVNPQNSINVFYSEVNTGYTGLAHSNLRTSIHRAWNKYLTELSSPVGQRWSMEVYYPWALSHEFGHNMGLSHTIKTNSGGICSTTMDDGCTDTPTINEILAGFGFNPCCGWDGSNPQCTNNMMDVAAFALTPCQLGKMHATILNVIPSTQLCKFPVQNTLTVTDFAMPQVLYQAKQISTSGSNAIVQNNEMAIMVGETDITLNSGFEVQLGGIFEAKTISSCP